MPSVSKGSTMATSRLDAERVPAPAVGRFVRILELDTLVHERLLPIEHRPRQIDEALGIDEHLDAIEIEHAVLRARRVVTELDHVRKPGAASPCEPQSNG